jgi:hypothetical protein
MRVTIELGLFVGILWFKEGLMSNSQGSTQEQEEQKFKEWSQSEYVKISKFCQSKGYQIKKVDQPKCQLLAPLVAIWYVKTTEANTNLWVISGDFPTDLTDANVAKNARQSLRHFSMAWHMQAGKLEQGVADGKIELQDVETQTKFAKELTQRAENLYQLYSDNGLWEASGQEA